MSLSKKSYSCGCPLHSSYIKRRLASELALVIYQQMILVSMALLNRKVGDYIFGYVDTMKQSDNAFCHFSLHTPLEWNAFSVWIDDSKYSTHGFSGPYIAWQGWGVHSVPCWEEQAEGTGASKMESTPTRQLQVTETSSHVVSFKPLSVRSSIASTQFSALLWTCLFIGPCLYPSIQPWHTPFPIWNQSVVPCPVLTVASWPAYRFFRRQVWWSDIPISWRIVHNLLWSTQGFGIFNKAEIDVFLELSCFFDDPVDVGNLISGSSAFSKTSLNIWNF